MAYSRQLGDNLSQFSGNNLLQRSGGTALISLVNCKLLAQNHMNTEQVFHGE